jgi:molybdopterin molybdotransferase
VAVFGLPGNPVSAVVSYLAVARPGLRVMAGNAPEPPRTVRAVAAERLSRRAGDGKLHLLRVTATVNEEGRLTVRSSGGQMSHQLGAMVGANALALLPDGPGAEAGDLLDVLLFGPLA